MGIGRDLSGRGARRHGGLRNRYRPGRQEGRAQAAGGRMPMMLESGRLRGRRSARSRRYAVAETPVERGEYLVRGPMGCGNCHTPQGPEGPDMRMELAGGQLVIDEPMIKRLVAPNITPAGRDRRLVGRRAGAGDPRGHPARRQPDRAADAVQPLQGPQRHRPRAPSSPSCGRCRRSRTRCRSRSTTSRCRRPRAAGRACGRHPARADGGVRRVPGRADRALRGVPHADGAAGADVRHRARAGRLRVPRALGRFGRVQHHLERGRARGLYRRRDRGDDHRGRAAGRHADAAADALRLSRADDARRPRGGDRSICAPCRRCPTG